MALTITLPPGATKAFLFKGDWSLQYWNEMTRPTPTFAAPKPPGGGTALTVTTGTVAVTLAAGERGVIWFCDTLDRPIAVRLMVGNKRYVGSTHYSWVDPEPGSIRSRPSTYAPPGTTSADPVEA